MLKCVCMYSIICDIIYPHEVGLFEWRVNRTWSTCIYGPKAL